MSDVFFYCYSLRLQNLILTRARHILYLEVSVSLHLAWEHEWLVSTSLMMYVRLIDCLSSYLTSAYQLLLERVCCTDVGRGWVPENFTDLYIFFLVEKVLLRSDNIICITQGHLTFITIQTTDLGQNQTCGPQWKGPIRRAASTPCGALWDIEKCGPSIEDFSRSAHCARPLKARSPVPLHRSHSHQYGSANTLIIEATEGYRVNIPLCCFHNPCTS